MHLYDMPDVNVVRPYNLTHIPDFNIQQVPTVASVVKIGQVMRQDSLETATCHDIWQFVIIGLLASIWSLAHWAGTTTCTMDRNGLCNGCMAAFIETSASGTA